MYLTLNEFFSKSENEVILLIRKEGDNIKCLMAVEFCLSYFYSDKNLFCIVYFLSIQFPFWSENFSSKDDNEAFTLCGFIR